MSVSEQLNLDLHTIPLEVFDLTNNNFTVDSLTTGHGMAENAASLCWECGICSCCDCAPAR